MIDPENIYLNIIRLLDENQVSYKLFTHRAALSYEDLAKEQKETGFFGTEGKCMILRVDIFVDPTIYQQEWLLFSPVLSTKTVQAKGEDLRKVFSQLPNKVTEVTDFNQ